MLSLQAEAEAVCIMLRCYCVPVSLLQWHLWNVLHRLLPGRPLHIDTGASSKILHSACSHVAESSQQHNSSPLMYKDSVHVPPRYVHCMQALCAPYLHKALCGAQSPHPGVD